MSRRADEQKALDIVAGRKKATRLEREIRASYLSLVSISLGIGTITVAALVATSIYFQT